ncbi:uncharacterized protein LOC144625927 [Crassostrea virginica]
MTSQSSSSIETSSTKVSDAFKSSESSTIPKVLTTSTSSDFPSFSTSTSGSLSSAGIGPSTSAGILSTTGQSSEDHQDPLPYLIMILFVVFFGIFVFCLCAVALRKCKRNRSSIRISRKENCLHETGQVLVTRVIYDEVDVDMEVTFTSTLNRNEGKEIKDVKQYDGGCDEDDSPYAECPENVYD